MGAAKELGDRSTTLEERPAGLEVEGGKKTGDARKEDRQMKRRSIFNKMPITTINDQSFGSSRGE